MTLEDSITQQHFYADKVTDTSVLTSVKFTLFNHISSNVWLPVYNFVWATMDLPITHASRVILNRL
jgi:hypothetical protein